MSWRLPFANFSDCRDLYNTRFLNETLFVLQRCYRAMYDYAAGDTDEVSFLDGDLIINCTAIDEGWLTGTSALMLHS